MDLKQTIRIARDLAPGAYRVGNSLRESHSRNRHKLGQVLKGIEKDTSRKKKTKKESIAYKQAQKRRKVHLI